MAHKEKDRASDLRFECLNLNTLFGLNKLSPDSENTIEMSYCLELQSDGAKCKVMELTVR